MTPGVQQNIAPSGLDLPAAVGLEAERSEGVLHGAGAHGAVQLEAGGDQRVADKGGAVVIGAAAVVLVVAVAVVLRDFNRPVERFFDLIRGSIGRLRQGCQNAAYRQQGGKRVFPKFHAGSPGSRAPFARCRVFRHAPGPGDGDMIPQNRKNYKSETRILESVTNCCGKIWGKRRILGKPAAADRRATDGAGRSARIGRVPASARQRGRGASRGGSWGSRRPSGRRWDGIPRGRSGAGRPACLRGRQT